MASPPTLARTPTGASGDKAPAAVDPPVVAAVDEPVVAAVGPPSSRPFDVSSPYPPACHRLIDSSG
jgi:hypothetical protein